MKNFFNSLFWKISALFLLILIIISCVYMYISVFTAEMYFQETRQKLDLYVADHIANEYDYFNEGKVNRNSIDMIFHNVMVINPSIEVYLIDTEGKILAYYAPDHTVEAQSIPLEPIKEFLTQEDQFVLGLDPKNPLTEKAFSAAEVYDDGIFKGYIYVILGGEEYENASQLVFGSYILRLGIRSMGIALLTAAIVGFIAIGFITRNIRRINSVITEFQSGNLEARIKLKGKGELSEFANSFNSMADTIVADIEKIKSIDSQRRDLIANVSHDLRTPLSVIHGYVETALIKSDTLNNDEKNKYLETILSSTKRLLKLVEELFELSKLEAKQIEPNFEVFSIAELAQDVHQKNKIIAQKKNIDLQLKINSDSTVVKADISMIEKVFQNLIDNAIKYTESSGSVTIQIDKSLHGLNISISDNGLGITENELPYIFDRYHKNKRVAQKGDSSAGLGLAIVKKIIELHNSEIKVESKESEGTTFSFFLKLVNSSVNS